MSYHSATFKDSLNLHLDTAQQHYGHLINGIFDDCYSIDERKERLIEQTSTTTTVSEHKIQTSDEIDQLEIRVLFNEAEEEQQQHIAAEVFSINANNTSADPSFSQADSTFKTSSNNSSTEQKSKKEALKEKREMKKVQLLERKQISFTHQSESDSGEQRGKESECYQNAKLSKEDRAERQRIKNRESAQISRDRKRIQDNQVQSSLIALKEENQKLKSQLEQQMSQKASACTSCDNHLSSLSANGYVTPGSSSVIQPFEECIPISTQPVFQFFDFSIRNVQTAAQKIPPVNGGWNSHFIVIMILAMILLSGAAQTEVESRHVNLDRLSSPYNEIFDHCKEMNQNQLLECLVFHMSKLDENQRMTLMNQLNLFETIRSEQSEKSLKAEHGALLTALKDFNKQQEETNKQNSSDLIKKLEILQDEKIQQLEILKLQFCNESLDKTNNGNEEVDLISSSKLCFNLINRRSTTASTEESEDEDLSSHSEESFSFNEGRKQLKVSKVEENQESNNNDMYQQLFSEVQPKSNNGINYYEYLLNGQIMQPTQQYQSYPVHTLMSQQQQQMYHQEQQQQQQQLQPEFLQQTHHQRYQWNPNQHTQQQQIYSYQ